MGYIPKFSDSDTLTTGTLYYNSSNDLVFTELPITTTSENLYKLVVENNIVKTQLDTGSGTSLIEEFTVASHGFNVGDVIGYAGGTNYFLAKADSAANAEVLGVVKSVTTNTFKVVIDGKITGLSGLTAGNIYFLSTSDFGTWQPVEPSGYGQISKPLLFALSATEANVLTYRGFEITPVSGTSGTSGSSGSSEAVELVEAAVLQEQAVLQHWLIL